MRLPDLEILRDYPTLGPAGESRMDVNGLAASIELYLGRDVLTNPVAGHLVCVQWKGYVAGVRKYQGEILDKRRSRSDSRKNFAPLNLMSMYLDPVIGKVFATCSEDYSKYSMSEDSKAMIDMIRWQYENWLLKGLREIGQPVVTAVKAVAQEFASGCLRFP